MKKRMIAILLSLSILCSSLTVTKRSYAAPAPVVGVVEVGIMAWMILDVITQGKFPGIVEAMQALIESGIDAFTNPDSAFRQKWGAFWDNWGTGWEALCDMVQSWFDSGDITLGGDVLKISYEQYLEAYSQIVSIVNMPSVEFESDYFAFLIDFDYDVDGMPADFPIGALPSFPTLMETNSGESYALCYYNDEQIVFSDYYILVAAQESKSSYSFSFNSLSNSFYSTRIAGVSTLGANANLLENPDNCFSFLSLYSSSIKIYSSDEPKEYNTSNCFVYSNGTITYTPISEVDLTGFKYGLVSTVSDYGGFLRSLKDFSVTASAISGTDVSDLSNALPTEENPSLSFPLNPDLDKPIADQVIVGDVAGAEDLPLSDYLSKALDIDINVPSVILTKFPFCIPYDFVRFLGVLAADPIPPVFHIPISTHPKNLEQWADNETIGDLVSPENPMFEIDEEIVLDFAHIPLVQPICYTVFIVGFVILLIQITSKLIQH